jgi:hypothetical protein
MSDQPKQIADPTNLEMASAAQLIDELRKRFHSLIVVAFPLPSNTGQQKPDYYAYGNYYLNLATAINLVDRLRANNPLLQPEAI